MYKIFLVVIFLAGGMFIQAQPVVELINNPGQKKIDVLVDGDLFTSYIYPENLKKPVFNVKYFS